MTTFDLKNSHVLPALIRKMHLAKCLENSDFNSIADDLYKDHPNTLPLSSSAGNKKIIELLANYGIKNTKPVSLELWGSGNPKREFLHSKDLADACVFIMEKINFHDILHKEFNIVNPIFPLTNAQIRNTHINIGIGKDLSIKNLAELVKKIVGFKGKIFWDTT